MKTTNRPRVGKARTREETREMREETRETREDARDEGRDTRDEGRHAQDEGRDARDEGRDARRDTRDEGRHARDEGRHARDEGRHARKLAFFSTPNNCYAGRDDERMEIKIYIGRVWGSHLHAWLGKCIVVCENILDFINSTDLPWPKIESDNSKNQTPYLI